MIKTYKLGPYLWKQRRDESWFECEKAISYYFSEKDLLEMGAVLVKKEKLEKIHTPYNSIMEISSSLIASDWDEWAESVTEAVNTLLQEREGK